MYIKISLNNNVLLARVSLLTTHLGQSLVNNMDFIHQAYTVKTHFIHQTCYLKEIIAKTLQLRLLPWPQSSPRSSLVGKDVARQRFPWPSSAAANFLDGAADGPFLAVAPF